MNRSAAQWKVATREEAIEKYRIWIRTQPKLLDKLLSLEGLTLGCWCKPLACHGDILIQMIECYRQFGRFW